MQVCYYVENVTCVNSTLHMVGAMPAKQRKSVLSRIGKLWRSHKAYLNEKYCNEGLDKEDLLEVRQPKFDVDKFHALVECWFSRLDMVLIFSVLLLYDLCSKSIIYSRLEEYISLLL